MEDKAKYIINELRQNIYKNRIDLEELFKQYDYSHDSTLEIKQFSKLMKSIDPDIDRTQIEYIFNKFDDNMDNTISFDEFTKWLSNNDVIMSTKLSANLDKKASSTDNVSTTNSSSNIRSNLSRSMSSDRANMAIQKLQFAIQKYKINLNDLFSKYDKSDDKQLDITEFSRLLKKVDGELTEEDIQCTFTIFDKNNDRSITFNEFFDTLKEISVTPQR